MITATQGVEDKLLALAEIFAIEVIMPPMITKFFGAKERFNYFSELKCKSCL